MGIFLISLILQTQLPRVNYYIYLGEAGELQIKVSVWGEIMASGLYSIPDGTDLATFLSLAGGTSESANLSQIKVIHSFPTPSVTIVDMRDFFKTGNRESIPVMKPGDMVRIKKTFYANVRETVHHLAEVTLLVGVCLQLYNTFILK